MAAALASGLYGIRHQLKLDLPATSGNAYADHSLQRIPATLDGATRQMKNSPIADDLFGGAFVQHFCATREWNGNNTAKPSQTGS